MNALRSLLGSQAPSETMPAIKYEDDDVYPLHPLDDTKAAKTVVSWLMRFNDVLDADKLHVALSRLLEIGDWRKLGGRMRHQSKERIEIHVPKKYSRARPSVTYIHDDLRTMKLVEHPLAQTLPTATPGASTQPHLVDVEPLVAPPGMQATHTKMVDCDLPQLSLRITSFSDATLVAVSWPHSLMDASGTQALLRAWSLVLAGREAEVSPIVGAHEDKLPNAINIGGDESHETYVLEPRRVSTFGLIMWFLRFFRDMFWNPSLETRTIFLPGNIVANWRSQVQSDLISVFDNNDNKVFVSESDVISAWMTRMVAVTEPAPRPVTLVGALNARFRLQLPDKTIGTYIQNMLIPVYVFLTSEMANGPLAPIVLAHRQQLVQQATEAQVSSLLRIWFRDIARNKSSGLLFGDTTALPIISNNLTRIEVVRTVDFSAAVIRGGEQTKARNNPSGTMTNYFVHGAPKKLNFFEVLGKDHGGNYWMNATLRPRAWSMIKTELDGA